MKLAAWSEGSRMPWVRARSFVLVTVVIIAALTGCGAQGASALHSTPQPTPTLRAPTPTPAPPVGITVQGSRFASQGRVVTLVGVNHSSLEYSCAGDGHFTPADFQAMRGWGMNVVRIPLSSEFWANAGADCPGYRATVIQAVANARAAHLFVILDLQWSAPFDTQADRAHGGVQCPLPDAGKDVAFWQDLATLYHNDTGVLFDLFGEPFDIAWPTWLNGGTISSGCYVIGGPSLQKEPGTYQAIGMRALVARVRELAPDNVIILGGTNWGYDLSGIPQGFALQGTNLAYDTHPFDYGGKQPGDWPSALDAAAQRYTVIAGEFGSYTCGTDYIAQAISYFNAHYISWLAWTWGPYSCSTPSLLAAWPDVPSVPYGTYIKQQMLQLSARGA